MRALTFTAIGCAVGLIGGLLLGIGLSTGAMVIESVIVQAVIGVIFGGALGFVAHVLSRPKAAGESFMPKPRELSAAESTRPVKICTFVGGVLGFTAMMVGNIVFHVVPGGAIGGAIGAGAGSALGRVIGMALFPIDNETSQAS